MQAHRGSYQPPLHQEPCPSLSTPWITFLFNSHFHSSMHDQPTNPTFDNHLRDDSEQLYYENPKTSKPNGSFNYKTHVPNYLSNNREVLTLNPKHLNHLSNDGVQFES